MSVFSIKLKTRNGNDVKKKETITVFFKTKYRAGIRPTPSQFTFRIMSSQGVYDTLKVYDLKDRTFSYEDMMLKVIINLCHMVEKLSKDGNYDPDFILFMTPDLQTPKNKAFMFIKDIFFRPESKTSIQTLTKEQIELTLDTIFSENWDAIRCSLYKLKYDELEMLQQFSKKHCLSKVMFIDPSRNPVKYAKSIHIIKMLEDRLSGQLQLSKKP